MTSFGLERKTYYTMNWGWTSKYILTDNTQPTGYGAQILVSERGENSIAVAPGSKWNLNFSKN